MNERRRDLRGVLAQRTPGAGTVGARAVAAGPREILRQQHRRDLAVEHFDTRAVDRRHNEFVLAAADVERRADFCSQFSSDDEHGCYSGGGCYGELLVLL